MTAVLGSGPDAPVASHYGDPFGEQRAAERGAVVVDRSHRGVLVVPGEDRLSWLHTVSSQHLAGLRDGDATQALVLSPNGHVEQHWWVTELGGQVWLDVEPDTSPTVLKYLSMMRFLLRVEPTDVTSSWAVLAVLGPTAPQVLVAAGLPLPDGELRASALAGGGFVRQRRADEFDLVVPRASMPAVRQSLLDAGARAAGTWAYEARRVARREPRFGFETDHRTLPHEVFWIGPAVHLDKGCYRGQETVARVHNLGRPPRRLALLQLAGESDELPAPGTPVELDGRAVGFLGTAVQHHEDGPIALAVLKRNVADDAALTVGSVTAAIDPTPFELPDLPAHAGKTYR
ncbi:CAF17-like 4Fe-4S cluster assembly/insertion protein YgfZ [Jatrophihabitans sp. YIM 134969]